jgi:hypothetical protein
MGDMTWEPEKACHELQALNEYLQLQGIQEANDLPQKNTLDSHRA